MMRIIVVCLPLLLILHACVNYQPATFTNNQLQNPSLGYDGYSVRMPDAFILDDGKVTNSPSLNHLRKEFFSTNYIGEFKLEYHETFIFYNREEDISIGFKVNVINFPAPLEQLEDKTEQLMISSMIGTLRTSPNGADTQVINVSDRPGLLVHDRHQYSTKSTTTNAQSLCFVLGEVSELYMVSVEGAPAKREKVKSHAQSVCQSITL